MRGGPARPAVEARGADQPASDRSRHAGRPRPTAARCRGPTPGNLEARPRETATRSAAPASPLEHQPLGPARPAVEARGADQPASDRSRHAGRPRPTAARCRGPTPGNLEARPRETATRSAAPASPLEHQPLGPARPAVEARGADQPASDRSRGLLADGNKRYHLSLYGQFVRLGVGVGRKVQPDPRFVARHDSAAAQSVVCHRLTVQVPA